MESIFDRIDYGFGSDFSKLPTDKKDSKASTADRKNISQSDSKLVSDLFSDIENFSRKKPDKGIRGETTFDESDFKYLISKSPIDGDGKKSGKNKKEMEEEERERMQ